MTPESTETVEDTTFVCCRILFLNSSINPTRCRKGWRKYKTLSAFRVSKPYVSLVEVLAV